MNIDWPSAAGLHDRAITLADGEQGLASLALPPGLGAGAPLVLCLHYGGTPVGYYGRPLLESLLLPAWAPLGAVMLAPVARRGDWSADTAFVLELLARTAAHYGCGPRIVTGYSLGAIGTWHLLAQSPQEFVAGVPIAGPPPASVAGDTPVRALNAGADQLFDAGTTVAAIQTLAASGRDAACVLVDGIDHYDVGGFATALAALVPWLAGRCAAPARAR